MLAAMILTGLKGRKEAKERVMQCLSERKKRRFVSYLMQDPDLCEMMQRESRCKRVSARLDQKATLDQQKI